MPTTKAQRLKRARRTKTLIAREIESLHRRDALLRDVLGQPSNVQGRIRIYDAMCATPGLGDSAVKKILTKANVWPMARINQLTEAERARVVKHLPDRVS